MSDATHERAPHADAVDYGSYLALDELLSLQRPRSRAGASEHPDELLFIVVHQASELWFKAILHELGALRGCLAASEDPPTPGERRPARAAESALWHVQRLNALMRIVSAQLSSLAWWTTMNSSSSGCSWAPAPERGRWSESSSSSARYEP